MNGHKQAAAALHGLSTADQDKVLAELPPADQDILRGYLAELSALGFARAPAVAAAARPAASVLRNASAEALFAVLAQEPAGLVAQFLALEAWPAGAALLALFPGPQRERIAAAQAAQGPVAPAVARTLVELVAGRLPAAAAAPGWRAALAKVFRWTR
ncbi:hypothetical protein ACN9MY_29540 [Pseudoduganella sp. R-31]|uniref:hypothetical protein n=1 Tax=unclassified Pseudoduganella TaxID=2637179 RepID=UPI003CF8FDE2